MKNQLYHYESGDKLWFTSDTHFNHAGILRFCHRPFKDIAEMNTVLIRRWNECVGSDDIIFHLGDFGFGHSGELMKILKGLNGRKIWILGNHDIRLKEQLESGFDFVSNQMNIRVGRRHIILNHFPFLCYSGSWRESNPSLQFFGHVHSGPLAADSGLDYPRLQHLFPTQYDVGVDNNDFRPISFNQIIGKMGV